MGSPNLPLTIVYTLLEPNFDNIKRFCDVAVMAASGQKRITRLERTRSNLIQRFLITTAIINSVLTFISSQLYLPTPSISIHALPLTNIQPS